MRTIAVDWSGRRHGAARHIWAAEVAAGELVSLSNGRSGPQLAGWLVDQASAGEQLAVGLDFAFSVPAWYLHALGVPGAPELWDLAAVDGESWLSACQAPFWGRKGAGKPTGAALRERAASTEDAFDAALSALAMHEHQEDLATPAPVPEIAALEGWIWCPRTSLGIARCGKKS